MEKMKNGRLEKRDVVGKNVNCCLQWCIFISQICAMKELKYAQHALLGSNQGKW